MPKRVPHVSEHAIIRWLERVKGVDLDAIRAEILSPLVRAAIKAGASSVIIDGHRCPVAQDGTITTVLDSDMRSRTADDRRRSGVGV